MNKQIIYILGAVLLLTGSVQAATNAIDLPLYTETGVIDEVRLNENVIIISDQLFNIVPYAKVHGNSKYSDVFGIESLRQGIIVGVKLDKVGNNSRVITEIWLLNALPSEDDDD